MPIRNPVLRGGITAVAAVLALSAGAPGCAVHRVQDEPSPVVAPPPSFPASAESPGRAAAEPTPAAPWWSEFDDAALSGLIEESLAANLTVADFAGRLAAARAVARQAGAELRPAADASGSLGLASEDEDGVDGAVDGLEFSGGVAVAVSWEIDLFGRLASRERGAVLDALASADDLDAVRLAVAADAAAAYYAAVEQRLLLELLQRQIERDRTLLDLIELRFAQGGANSLDVLQQRAQLAEARALVPGARARRRLAENTLDALLGTPADGVDRVRAGLPGLPEVPEAGVPSDLLTRRPDLRATRRRLIAADERIGEAVADRLPRLTLTGALGYRDAFGDSGFGASVLGGLAAPLLDGGRRAAVVDERRAAYRALLADYSQDFVSAVAEVDGLLYGERRQREQVAVLTDRVALLDRAVAEAQNRYVNGIGDYTDVLVALSDLQETQREQLAARAGLIQQRVAVYRAVGGPLGVSDTPEPPDTPGHALR